MAKITKAAWLKICRTHLKREEAALSQLEMIAAKERASGGRPSRSITLDLAHARSAVRSRRAEIARVLAGGSVVK